MRGLGSLAACALVLAAPGQLAAQAAGPTPDDDLDCAVLFSVALGERGDAASDREKPITLSEARSPPLIPASPSSMRVT